MKTRLLTSLAVLAFTHTLAFAGDDAELTASLDEAVITETLSPVPSNIFDSEGNIAVARLDGGRLIPTPYEEEQDWTFLDRRIEMKVTQLGAGTYIQYIPEIPHGSHDTDNKIDEIRLAAANEGYHYVLIYGVGPDASWASFGGKVLSETGLKISNDCQSWDGARSKALLVESHTGHVFGAVTANDIEFNIGQLADRVETLIKSLSDTEAAKA